MGVASTRAWLGRMAVFLTLCSLLTGCGKSKVTKENFDKVANEMTLDQVQAVLGEGSPVGDGSMVAAQVGVDVSGGAQPSSTVDYIWEKGTKSITVTFKQGKVIGKRSTGL